MEARGSPGLDRLEVITNDPPTINFLTKEQQQEPPLAIREYRLSRIAALGARRRVRLSATRVSVAVSRQCDGDRSLGLGNGEHDLLAARRQRPDVRPS